MSTPTNRPDHHRDLPVGRRIAQLRTRRGMNQQVLADRIGKSKSWVDKVERGVRRLDRLSTIEAVAAALGVSTAVLLGRNTRRPPTTGTSAAVERIREALADYDTPTGRDWPSSTAELDRQINYAHTAYRHAHHVQVLRVLPGLLVAARHARRTHTTTDTWPATPLLVRVYRLTAHVLVKLGEPHLAWLTADRAITIAAGDPHLIAHAAVPLAQALRALDRSRLALAAATAAVRPIDLAPYRRSLPDQIALAGMLLTEAAIAAATHGDAIAAHDLIDRAEHLAVTQHHHDDGFGPVVIELARTLVAARLGDQHNAIAHHQRATRHPDWQRLPAEHRAAHLIDMARIHLDAGDHYAAGRTLVTADHVAPTEVRLRPVTHTILATVLRSGSTPADVTRLAAFIGLTTPWSAPLDKR
ncbi:Helix-turn-helix domain-containing protein [Micromonospora echinospora]|uniref:Helix-turn-helix domain-containing protein n=1 Tax=Micromonospora echinospora TaxID=1877 RepID=A0A1C4YNB2_MICEC|nr:helix-turn-helix domain-containing protein [Micromonospora echinospora]SCF22262.1 Helix-turn-helix domain-containing protein [Micromonospora echinospora]